MTRVNILITTSNHDLELQTYTLQSSSTHLLHTRWQSVM